jgi:hypothetical protein
MIRTILITLVLFTVVAIASEVKLEDLKAKANGSVVTVQWNCQSENSILRYEIERASSDNMYSRVGAVDARGLGHYTFEDRDAVFKGGATTVAATTYYYKIRTVLKDNSYVYSSPVSVTTQRISSVARTWGMIKYLFR